MPEFLQGGNEAQQAGAECNCGGEEGVAVGRGDSGGLRRGGDCADVRGVRGGRDKRLDGREIFSGEAGVCESD